MDEAEGGEKRASNHNEPTTALENLLSKERQVDNSSQKIELLTKRYEQFKKQRSGRMMLYIAAEIAVTYFEAGKYDMALKFFERIGKTYRKENWNMILTSILRWSLRCAKELGYWERAIECLFELLASDLPMSEQKRVDIQTDFFETLKNRSKNDHHPMSLSINAEQINPLLTCHVQFKSRSNFVNTLVPFQITLRAGKTSPPRPFRFNAVRILFNDPQYNHVIVDADMDGEDMVLPYELINCHEAQRRADGEYAGWFWSQADLRVIKGQTKVFEAHVVPETCDELRIIGVCLDIKSSQWHVALNYDMDRVQNEEQAHSRRKWLEVSPGRARPSYTLLDGRGEVNMTRITRRPPRVKMFTEYSAQALLDELFELRVKVENEEDDAIDAYLHVNIKDTVGEAQDYVTFTADNEDQKEASQSIELGRVGPSESCSKSVYLCGKDSPGIRIVTLTARYVSADTKDKDPSQYVEKTETIRINFRTPFESTFRLFAQAERPPSSASPELGKSEKWLVVASIRCCATCDLEVDQVELKQASLVHPNTRLTLISDSSTLTNNQIWAADHIYDAKYLFHLATEDVTEPQPSVPVGSVVIRWRRRGGDTSYFRTDVPLPMLEFRKPSLLVIAEVPDEIYVGEPFTLHYTVHNPTVHLAEYTASVELSDAFAFSGLKLVKGRVLPLSRATYHYTCYPLLAGKVKLPRLKVIAKQQGMEKEIPVELLGSSEDEQQLQQRPEQGGGPEQWPPLMTFVNARRYY